jgi:lipopolysaccharide biosynthesis glycosyltransferase
MKIPIVLSSDDSYVEHLGVALCSLFENKEPQTELDINVLENGITEKNKKIINILENKYNFKINYITINVAALKKFPEPNHLKIPTYFRLFIPEIIKQKKIIYLDSDIVVLKDLELLFKTDLEGKAFGASKDVLEKAIMVKKNLKRYFNAGVLLIDCESWEKNKITEKTTNFITKYPEKLEFADQDALNYSCQEYWKEIDPKFNRQLNKDIRKINGESFILHYVSSMKPWHFSYVGIKKDVYKKYLKKTPWQKNIYTDKNLKNFFKKIVKIAILNIIFLKSKIIKD